MSKQFTFKAVKKIVRDIEFAFKAYSEMLSTGKSFVDIVNSMRTFKSE